jgi:hypothetical protein
VRRRVRSRLDIRFGRALLMGQEWLRRSDETVWLVRQVHRVDCDAVLERDGERITVTFADMRGGWARVHALGEAAA